MVDKKRSTSHLLAKGMLRTIKKDWKQFISIIAISFLSVCLFAGLIANADKINNRSVKLYEETNYAEIYVTTSGHDTMDLEQIKKIAGVKDAEERTYLPVEYGKDGINIIVSDSENELTHPLLISGKPGYLAMTKFMDGTNIESADSIHHQIGDTLTLTIGNVLLTSNPSFVALLNNYVKEGKTNVFANSKLNLPVTITGTMYHPEGVQNSSFSSSLGYMTKEYLQATLIDFFDKNYDLHAIRSLLPDFDNYILNFIENTSNQILISTSTNFDTKTVLESLKNYYAAKENNNLMIATEKEYLEAYQMLNQDVTQAGKLPYVFPLIFFLVSILVIMTTISQMIIKERSQIGSLKATGVPHKYIYLHYMSLGFVLTLIGGLLGMILGPIIIPPVMEIKYNLLWDLPAVNTPFISWQGFSILAAMLLITILCSFSVSHSVIKEKPVLTLRPKIAKAKKRETNPNNFFYKHTGLPIRMAWRNISKNKTKTIMVMLGTLGCAALAVCGFGIMDTLNYGIDYDYNQNVNMKVSATPLNNTTDIEDKVLELEGVEHIEAVSSYAITLTSETSYVVTSMFLMEDNSVYFPGLKEAGGLNIDETTAGNIGVQVGDTVTITINNNNYERTINRIFSSCIQHGIYDAFTSYSEPENIMPTYYIYGKEGVTDNQLKTVLDNSNLFDSTLTYNDMRNRAHEIMSSIELMTNVVKVFAILLCIVVIYNLTSLNISERNRDIATMKVLGFKFKQIATTLTTELMIDTVIGALLGLLLGFPMTYLVLSVNITNLLTFMYHVYWYSYIFGFLLTAGTAFVVSFLLNYKIKKIKMVESLKSIE